MKKELSVCQKKKNWKLDIIENSVVHKNSWSHKSVMWRKLYVQQSSTESLKMMVFAINYIKSKSELATFKSKSSPSSNILGVYRVIFKVKIVKDWWYKFWRNPKYQRCSRRSHIIKGMQLQIERVLKSQKCSSSNS